MKTKRASQPPKTPPIKHHKASGKKLPPPSTKQEFFSTNTVSGGFSLMMSGWLKVIDIPFENSNSIAGEHRSIIPAESDG